MTIRIHNTLVTLSLSTRYHVPRRRNVRAPRHMKRDGSVDVAVVAGLVCSAVTILSAMVAL